MRYLFYMLIAIGLFSCSQRVMEFRDTHYFHDNYLILRKNGHYSGKTLVLGVFRLPDTQRGRYLRQNDSIYFVHKESMNLYSAYAYGYIDSTARIFSYRHKDSANWVTYSIQQMPTRKRDREMKNKSVTIGN
jgi:hypothetical protein